MVNRMMGWWVGEQLCCQQGRKGHAGGGRGGEPAGAGLRTSPGGGGNTGGMVGRATVQGVPQAHKYTRVEGEGGAGDMVGWWAPAGYKHALQGLKGILGGCR